VIRIELTENEQPIDYPLPAELGGLLAESGIVTAAPSISPGMWTVAPAGKVGVARLRDVEVWIRPKIDIARLVFLIGYARDPKGWRDSPVELGTADDLVTAVAYAFARQAEQALRQGVLQGYREREDALPVLRGRIRETAQLGRRFGMAVPLEVRYDEFTVDIAENQLLRTATQVLLTLPRLTAGVRQQLHKVLLRLGDVTPLVRGRPAPPWAPTRLNGRYHVALRLAEVVLAASSFEQARGSLLTSGFLFDMPKVFEDFVCVALRDALARHGGAVRLQDREHHLDVAQRVQLRPDLVWWVAGRPVAVVDAKYKAEKPSGFPEADVYQMLAYCTALGLDRGYLVYARGNEIPNLHEVRNAGITVACHAIDLDTEPMQLLAELDQLARSLVPEHPSMAELPTDTRHESARHAGERSADVDATGVLH